MGIVNRFEVAREMKLTPSQEEAIQSQKRIAKMAYGNNVEFNIWQPRNTDIVKLVCTWEAMNALGKTIKRSSAWIIGKRGRIDNG